MVKVFNSEQFYKHSLIDRADLENELCINPSNLAYYIEQAALWSGQVDLAKLLRDNRAAEIYVELKNSSNKVTDGYISATQQLDEQHQESAKKLKLAREQLALYEGAVTALLEKQKSLGSLNSRERREYDATTAVVPTRSTSEEKADRKARVLSAQ